MEIKNIKGDVIRTINDAELRMGALSNANLYGADLCDAVLISANLHGANLCRANLFGSNLNSANLYCAYLINADLRYADLRYADLRGADLRYADLRGADLRDAYLFDADLRGANLIDIKYNTNTSFYAPVPPEKGSFIAYKKINLRIIELEIPADAERSSATTRKCRCSKAKVLGVYNFDRTPADIDTIINNTYTKTTYKVGEMVYPDSWDEDRWNECSNGIHFFMTFDEAKMY